MLHLSASLALARFVWLHFWSIKLTVCLFIAFSVSFSITVSAAFSTGNHYLNDSILPQSNSWKSKVFDKNAIVFRLNRHRFEWFSLIPPKRNMMPRCWRSWLVLSAHHSYPFVNCNHGIGEYAKNQGDNCVLSTAMALVHDIYTLECKCYLWPYHCAWLFTGSDVTMPYSHFHPHTHTLWMMRDTFILFFMTRAFFSHLSQKTQKIGVATCWFGDVTAEKRETQLVEISRFSHKCDG